MTRQGTRRQPGRAQARHVPGVMNQGEARYASEYLQPMLLGGKILEWKFEPVKLRIGDKCFYSPDFLVITAKREIEMHEFKGHWEDDARVKIKAAAALFWWAKFVAITRFRNVLQFKEIRAPVAMVDPEGDEVGSQYG